MICFEDELMIIYDKSNDSNLLVGRKEKDTGFDVLKEFKGKKADELYNYLTGNEVDHL